MDIKLNIYQEIHPRIANSYNNLGYISSLKGEQMKAIEYYQQALNIYRQALGEEHSRTKNIQEKIEKTLQKINEEK